MKREIEVTATWMSWKILKSKRTYRSQAACYPNHAQWWRRCIAPSPSSEELPRQCNFWPRQLRHKRWFRQRHEVTSHDSNFPIELSFAVSVDFDKDLSLEKKYKYSRNGLLQLLLAEIWCCTTRLYYQSTQKGFSESVRRRWTHKVEVRRERED